MSDETRSDELRARLEAAKAARAKAAAERAELQAATAPELEVTDAELEARNEAAIAAAERTHGPVGKKIRLVHCDLGVVIVKRADSRLFRKFLDDEDFSTTAAERLVLPCLVYPSPDVFDRWVEEQPAIVGRAANEIATLAGVKAKETAGK